MAAPAARRKAGSAADVRVTRLAGLPLFAGVPAATLEAVAARMERVQVEAGEVVIHEGGVADRFYLIEEGTFEVSRRPVVDAGPGEIAPLPTVLEATPSSTSGRWARARSSARSASCAGSRGRRP